MAWHWVLQYLPDVVRQEQMGCAHFSAFSAVTMYLLFWIRNEFVLKTRRHWFTDQFLKQGPVVNHGLAQVFGVGLSPRLKNSALMGGTVVFENQGMIHGNVRGTLFKVSDRIAARGHNVAQKLIGIRHGGPGAVNEPSLDPAPRLDKPHTIAWSEWLDAQALDSFRALIKRRFCFLAAPAFLHGAGVFCAAKLSAQSFRPAFTSEKPNSDTCSYQHGDRDDYAYLCSAHC
jgi:hypothetical protein